MKKFTVTENTTLKEFTDCTYPQGSFVLRALLKAGDVRINGVKTKADAPLFAGDEVIYYTTAKQESAEVYKVVYEDENILIADKPGGVSSEGLFSLLRGFFPVHRLDRNTCGLIALAKSEKVQEELIAAFRERRVQKTYFCLAANKFPCAEDRLTAYLKKDEKNALARIYARPNGDCERILTEYKVVEERGDIAKVRVILHTGKTHQIRAHLAFIGCPVLGDEKYGDRALNKKYGVKRQVLVAKCLSFNLDGALAYLNGRSFESGFEAEIAKR